MSSGIKGVAVILPPNEDIHHGEELCVLVTAEDGSEELARQALMDRFARTTFGHLLPNIDPTDAWALWQVAQKNGFRMKTLAVTARTLE